MSLLLSRNHPSVTAAILAGGRATRMEGAAKALLEVGGSAILDRQLGILRPRFGDIVVVTASSGDPQPFRARGLRVVTDLWPEAGPLGGLHAALVSCRTPWLFAVACDMPFLDGDMIDRLTGFASGDNGADAFVPKIGERPDPLHALYRASIASRAEECLERGKRAMSDLLDAVETRYLDEENLPGLVRSRSLSNLNTPRDLAAAESRD